jgi:hypothetical protein
MGTHFQPTKPLEVQVMADKYAHLEEVGNSGCVQEWFFPMTETGLDLGFMDVWLSLSTL